MYYIADKDYDLSNKEVVEILNGDFGSTFDKEVTSNDVGRWTKNYEINAIKGDGTRWRYRREDLRDFLYRYQQNLLHKFNFSYHSRTRCRVPTDILRDFFLEEKLFQVIVCMLVTLHPYALFNDPERYYEGLHRAEGGIIFKGAAVHFSTASVGPKTSALELRKQRLLYPVLIAQTILELSNTYSNIEGPTIREKILASGWLLVNNRTTYEQYLHETQNNYIYGGWSGLDHYLHEEIRPTIIVRPKSLN